MQAPRFWGDGHAARADQHRWHHRQQAKSAHQGPLGANCWAGGDQAAAHPAVHAGALHRVRPGHIAGVAVETAVLVAVSDAPSLRSSTGFGG